MRVATATYEALDKQMEENLDKASARARKNKRQTVMPQDL
jgi:histone H3/H4